MSVANIERFYRMALKNPEIVSELHLVTDPESFGSTAVRLGAAHGCIFTADEIGEWVRMKSDPETESMLEAEEGIAVG